MFFVTTLIKSFILTIAAIVIMTTTSIVDIPESDISPTITKGGYGDYVKSLSGQIPTLREWFASMRSNVRPWGQFANSENFRTPPTFQRMMKRAVNNVYYFKGNYLIISLILLTYSLLTSPMVLLVLLVTFMAGQMIATRAAQTRTVIAGREISLMQQYIILGLTSIPVFFWAGITNMVFWVLGVSCFITSLHAAFYNIDTIINPADQVNILFNQVI